MSHCKWLSFSHFNIRSICTGFDLFSETVIRESLDVLGLSETWLDSSFPTSGIIIQDYKLIRNDRSSRGGGVAFYIKKNLKYRILDIPDLQGSQLESLWVTVTISGKSICLGTLYRPPNSNLRLCLDHLENIISMFLPEFDHLIFGGDLNVDLLNRNNNNTYMLSQLLNNYGLHQQIELPTRVTGNSSTLIDVIITSSNNIVVESNVLKMDDISDHSLVTCNLKIKKDKQEPKFFTFRDFSKFNYHDFLQDLYSINWGHIYLLENIDEMLQFWNNNLLHLFNIHAPFKTVRATKQPAPWLTENIKYMIKLKNAAHTRYKKLKTDISWNEYKEMRNFVNRSIKLEKRAYLQFKYKADPKMFWRTLKSLNINKNNDISCEITDPNLINNFFVNNIPQVQGNDDFITEKYNDLKFPNFVSEFSFSPVTAETVNKLVRSLKSQAMGSDGINIKMLSLVFPQLSEYFTFIINFCLLKGVFPNAWKDAHVIPVPKNSSSLDMSNFRPISILPTFSKVLEKIVAEQLNTYFANNRLMPTNQSGFRSRHSTTTALLQVTDDLYRANDGSNNTCLILLDFSKAFDTLNHTILCKKLIYFGLGDIAITFFRNYLSNRRQRVCINNNFSDFKLVNHGVPQGSILGPLLFSIYASDFHTFLMYCSIHQYADDTQLYFSFAFNDYLLARDKINSDLAIIVEVSNAHGLALNESKTELLVFGKDRCKVVSDPYFEIILRNKVLTPVEVAKNLGLYLDVNLRFSTHVTKLVQKSYGKLKLLNMHREVLSSDIKLLLCDSLILSHLGYCDIVYWPALLDRDRTTLQRIQNACIKFSFNLRKFDHISERFLESKWLNLDERFKYHLACLVYKIDKYQTPEYLYLKLLRGSDTHERSTRYRHLYNVPKHSTVLFQRSFSYNAVKIFNKIPMNIKLLPNITSFSKQVKSWLFSSR